MSKLVNGDKTMQIFEGSCEIPRDSSAYDLFVELDMSSEEPDQKALRAMLLPVIRQPTAIAHIHNIHEVTKVFTPMAQAMHSVKYLLDETQSYNSTIRSRLRHLLEEILRELSQILPRKEAYEGRHKVIILRRLNAINKIIRRVHANVQAMKKGELEKELYRAFFIFVSVLKAVQAQFVVKRFLNHTITNAILCTKPNYSKPIVDDLVNHFGFKSIFPTHL